ncbi:MAG: hypothetical protein Q4C30_01580 [Bacteroidia bacterium]|nr:hypothetical protein [Bacteroidia bacterium]
MDILPVLFVLVIYAVFIVVISGVAEGKLPIVAHIFFCIVLIQKIDSYFWKVVTISDTQLIFKDGHMQSKSIELSKIKSITTPQQKRYRNQLQLNYGNGGRFILYLAEPTQFIKALQDAIPSLDVDPKLV